MNYPLTLEQYIAQMPMQEAELARMGAQIAEALSVIHQQGRVHGDVKPGNILVVSPGNYQLIGYENVRQYPEDNPDICCSGADTGWRLPCRDGCVCTRHADEIADSETGHQWCV